MIDTIGNCLYDQGLVNPGSKLRYNFLLTRGTCIVAEVTGEDGESFFIKFSEISDLEEEFGRLSKAKECYREFVPLQYGFYRLPALNLMISARIRHSSFTSSAIFRSPGPRLLKNLELFFRYSGETAEHPAASDLHGAILDSAFDHLRYRGSGELCAGLGSCHSILDDALVIPQHGDFVLNNFGQAGKRLYIFDWEDYGKISIPGLDLATFIFSVTGFNAEKISAISRSDPAIAASLREIVRRCCDHISLEHAKFLSLLPLYLVVFLYLKRDYGPEVQSVVQNCLVKLTKCR